MKKYLGIAVLGLLLAGAGCSAKDVVTYERFTAGETGLSFDVPYGVTVHDNVNGVPDLWKFEHGGDSYIVSYQLFDGRAIYANWEGLSSEEVTKTTNGDVAVYAQNGIAWTEIFFMMGNEESASVGVSKHEGTGVKGDDSSSDDEVYQHLLESVTLSVGVTGLQEIVDVDGTDIVYQEMMMLASGGMEPSLEKIGNEETRSLADNENVVVRVICMNDACAADAEDDGKVVMTFAEYTAARAVCEKEGSRTDGSCPYYNIGALDLFNVYYNYEGEFVFDEQYTP